MSYLEGLNINQILELIDYLTPEEREELSRLLDLSNPLLFSEDPIGFSYFSLGVQYLTDHQKEVLRSVQYNRYTLARAANAVGKGFIAAIAGLWFYNNPLESQIILTAPSAGNQRQIKRVWGEMVAKYLMNRDGSFNESLMYGGKLTHLNLEKNPRHFFRGETIPLTGTPEEKKAKFTGAHAERLLFIVDECDAVFTQHPEILEAIETCMSGGYARFLGLFNPRSPSGPIYDLERSGKANVIEISAFDHPNVKDGPIGIGKYGKSEYLIPGSVTREITVDRILDQTQRCNIEDIKIVKSALKNKTDVPKEYFFVPSFLDNLTHSNGRDTLEANQWRKVHKPQFYHMVLGRYGPGGENQLIAEDDIRDAQKRWVVWKDNGGHLPDIIPSIGLDIADEGQDSNTMAFRHGSLVSDIISWSGISPHKTSKRAFNHMAALYHKLGLTYEYSKEYQEMMTCCIDGIAVGAGVPDAMLDHLDRYNQELVENKQKPLAMRFEKVVVSKSSRNYPRLDGVVLGHFKSLRDELIWETMLWLKNDKGAMLPDYPDILKEGCSFGFYTVGEEISVTSTKDIRKSIGKSPDNWMALAMSFYRYRSFGLV